MITQKAKIDEIEIGEGLYSVTFEQDYEYDSDYGANADGLYGSGVWFAEDLRILEVVDVDSGKTIDLTTAFGKDLIDEIEADHYFQRRASDIEIERD